MNYRILQGDVLDQLHTLPNNSVQCVVTSPPYWGLRDYKIPASVWGGDPDCDHVWGKTIVENATNHTGKKRWQHTRNGRDEELPKNQRVAWKRTPVPQGAFCQHCGAWAGAYGLEPTVDLYIKHTVEIFMEVHRVLRPDGTLWLNIGDAYAGSWGGQSRGSEKGAMTNLEGASHQYGLSARQIMEHPSGSHLGSVKRTPGLKPKDLIGIPWRVAFALQAAGWWLRTDIIWHKPNPMPESINDRCTRAHEYIFLLTKNGGKKRCWINNFTGEIIRHRPHTNPVVTIPHGDDVRKVRTWSGLDYYFNANAIKEPVTGNAHSRTGIGWNKGGIDNIERTDRWGDERKPGVNPKCYNGGSFTGRKSGLPRDQVSNGPRNSLLRPKQNESFSSSVTGLVEMRNKRSVWTVPTQPYKDAHFATFPPKLIEPCILAGAAPGDTVLDPFCGSGTTLEVAMQHGRVGLGIELNPDYIAMAHKRLHDAFPLLVAAGNGDASCIDGESSNA